MDEHVIAPRRPLPPAPPLPPLPSPAAAAPADETSWYDPHDLLTDSGVHTGGSAADAARDLAAESGRLLVLDEQLLAALDAAAKAAEARRALTAGALPDGFLLPAAPSGLADLFAAAAAPAPAPAIAPLAVGGPTTDVAPLATLPPLPLPVASTRADLPPVDDDLEPATPLLDAAALQDADLDDEDLDDAELDDAELDDADLDDEDLDDGAEDQAAAFPVPLEVDVAAEFARHDDLVETSQHAALELAPSGHALVLADTGRHHLAVREDDGYVGRDGGADDRWDDLPPLGTLTHRTVVTRGSGRRWIPVGVGAGVLSIVAAVLLTSGFAANGPATGTDEAARTGAATTEPAAPTTTATTPPLPAMNTLDLSGPVVVDDSSRPVDEDTRPATTAAASRSTAPAATQPQVATPPAADTPVVAEVPVTTTTTPATLTAETAPPPADPVTPEPAPSS